MRLPPLAASARRGTTQQQFHAMPQIRPTAFAERFRAGGGLGFSCNPYFCACTGDADCNDMFTTPLCGAAICIDNSCFCLRR